MWWSVSAVPPLQASLPRAQPASDGRPSGSVNGSPGPRSEGHRNVLMTTPRTDRHDKLYDARLPGVAVPGYEDGLAWANTACCSTNGSISTAQLGPNG